MTQDTERWTEERRDEIIGDTAWHIDKFCTGGGDNDFAAAREIVDGIERSEMQPLRERLQEVERERDELREALERIANRSLVDGPEHLLLADFQSIARSALSEQEGGEPA